MAAVSVVCYVVSILLLIFSSEVSGYYCEWNHCKIDQYCCGDNQCCNYVYSLWYFWVGVAFAVLLVSACGGLFRYCYYNTPQIVVHRITSYIPVPNDITANEADSFRIHDVDGRHMYPSQTTGYLPPQGPPPPYSAASTAQESAIKLNKDHAAALYP